MEDGEALFSSVGPRSVATNRLALKFNGIDPYHPFRMAIEEKEALEHLFTPIRHAVKRNNCTRAILVGHNPAFDIGFLNAAIQRTKIKRSPFHPFSSFDTATLGGLAYQHTVLAKIAEAAGLHWDNAKAHSALYDAEKTAELFCLIVNRWRELENLATLSLTINEVETNVFVST
jgi:ribonuclease T